MISIEHQSRSITEDQRRADYSWNTKTAATAIGWHSNRFGSWWYSTRRKLTSLCRADPAAFHAEVARIVRDSMQHKR